MKLPDIAHSPVTRSLISSAIKEDVGSGDATSIALVPSGKKAVAEIVSRGNYIVSGSTVAKKVFKTVDGSLDCIIRIKDGKRVKKDQVIITVRGNARSILTAERTALNFMQRMTGIATFANEFVRDTKKYKTKILDTRKTTPGLRQLEKYAVLCGSGTNHRSGLYDRILIKDNHRRFWGCNRLDSAIKAARKRFPELSIEIEVESLAELRNALKAGPDWVLLDNMSIPLMRKCVRLCKGISLTEASGGINRRNIRQVAATGVDAISLGCLTHSVSSADLSLEIK